MKSKFLFLLSFAGAGLAFTLGSLSVIAEETRSPESRPLKVLFLGHDSAHHHSGRYAPLLKEKLEKESISMDYATRPECLNTEQLAKYDAVLLYANHGKMLPEQYDALQQFVESGHGFLPIHCASACFGNEPRFIAMVGGRFKSHGAGVFQVKQLDPKHPVFAGVPEFESWDETYVHDRINEEGRTLLAERVEGAHREPWTWVRTQGKGRVFYTASGHDERTWQKPEFQQLLRNAIVWAVGDRSREMWEAFRAKGGLEGATPSVANPSAAKEASVPKAP